MCVCYDTRSSYARANRVAALLLAQLWCARALACCCATCFLFLYVHTDLLLRFLLVFCMAGRPPFYATCSSCARAHWFAAAPLVFPQRTLRECTDHSSLKFSCGAQPSGRIVEEPAGNASFGPIFKSSRLVVWWIFEHQDSRFNLDMRELNTKQQLCVSDRATLILKDVLEATRPAVCTVGSHAARILGADGYARLGYAIAIYIDRLSPHAPKEKAVLIQPRHIAEHTHHVVCLVQLKPLLLWRRVGLTGRLC